MLLVLDAGNTHTVIGVFDGDKLKNHWRIYTDLRKTEDEYAMLFKNLLAEESILCTDIKEVAISCVVPPLNWILRKVFIEYCHAEPLLINSKVKLNIKIKIDNPEEMGADRVVNAVAAYTLYGAPAIIIDFGTATTFCALDKEGNYVGGAIAPGLELAGNALFEKTSKLPKVEMKKCDHAIGLNTVQAIQSGIYFGHLGLTRELIENFKKELTGDPIVIATGGYASLLGESTSLFDRVDPLLTLQGLKIIYNMNR